MSYQKFVLNISVENQEISTKDAEDTAKDKEVSPNPENDAAVANSPLKPSRYTFKINMVWFARLDRYYVFYIYTHINILLFPFAFQKFHGEITRAFDGDR